MPATTTPVPITGSESIVWDQAALDAAQLTHYHYIAYVDDVPTDPVSASCGPGTVSGIFTCRIKIPKIQPGRHRLQLAVEETDNQKRRSPRSNAILLDVAEPKTR
jgi:hypothetical protein